MSSFERHDLDKGSEGKKKPLTGQEFREGNLPGYDTYDDGLNEEGELERLGSTVAEGAGTYMEDTGPVDDGVQRQREEDPYPDLRIKKFAEDTVERETRGDAADEWLRENDPDYGK